MPKQLKFESFSVHALFCSKSQMEHGIFFTIGPDHTNAISSFSPLWIRVGRRLLKGCSAKSPAVGLFTCYDEDESQTSNIK